MLPSTCQPISRPNTIAHVDGGLPECCHCCVCWCRSWHRGAGGRVLTERLCTAAPHVHACVCPGTAGRPCGRICLIPWCLSQSLHAPEQSSIPASVLRSSTCIVPLRVQEIASPTLRGGSQLTLTESNNSTWLESLLPGCRLILLSAVTLRR